MPKHACDALWDEAWPEATVADPALVNPPPAPTRKAATRPKQARTVEHVIVLGQGFRVEVTNGRVTVELQR